MQQAHEHLVETVDEHYISEHNTHMLYDEVILLAWLIGFVVVAVVLALLSASILKPLRNLEKAALTLQNGNYNSTVRIEGNDEFTAVGRAFNAMAYALADTHETLYSRAMRDSLTGLLNRRGLTSALENVCSASAPASLLLIDVDRFKAINDSLGHDAGDRALVELTGDMRTVVRTGDSVGRYGGDEFLIILPGLDTTAAMTVAQRLLDQIHQSNNARSAPFEISIGVASKRDTPTSPHELLKAADDALYEAKKAGRGTARAFSTS
ncbi:diguanylate cyclase/phosphodiesterase [Salinisphaera shabanensis T35B1]